MTTNLAFGLPGNWEWIIIGLVMLLLFGSRLPQVARSFGDSIREFKKGIRDVGDETKQATREAKEPHNPYAAPPLQAGSTDPRVPSAGHTSRQADQPAPAHHD